MERRYSRRNVLGLFGSTALTGAALLATSGSSQAAPSTPTSATPETGGPAELLLRVELSGGFVPVEHLLTTLPIVSIYADGRVITTGPMIEIYPQPALPNLRQLVLTPAGIDRVLEEARKAGLFDGSANLAGPPVTDLPDTVFTLNAEGVSTVVSAYALGFDETALPPDSPNKDARARLIELQGFLTDLPSRLAPEEIATGDQPYEIERIRVYARAFDPANPPWDDPALEQKPVAWPLATPLSNLDAALGDDLAPGTTCAVFAGGDAAKLVAALKRANQLTPWESNGGLYLLWIRPLLPDEPATCA